MFKQKMIRLALAGVICAASMSAMAGSTAPTQPQQDRMGADVGSKSTGNNAATSNPASGASNGNESLSNGIKGTESNGAPGSSGAGSGTTGSGSKNSMGSPSTGTGTGTPPN